jgi:hypothetical protein
LRGLTDELRQKIKNGRSGGGSPEEIASGESKPPDELLPWDGDFQERCHS